MVKFRITIRQILSVLMAVCFFVASIQGQRTQPGSPDNASLRPLNLLVIGDSIMWGQGLRTENKAWYHVKEWLSRTTGREVTARIEAHSGAVLESASAGNRSAGGLGEVNAGLPTLIGQMERAEHYYAHHQDVDVILLSGCANDVGGQYVLNAANSVDEIRAATESKCRAPVEELLRRLSSAFPNAYIVVTGYYPFFSEKSRNDVFMRAMTKRFYKIANGDLRLPREVILRRVLANSEEWYRTSNRSLAEAVRQVNSELDPNASGPRVKFAEIRFLPEYSFAARGTRLWDFDRSFFRKLLVILSFGKVLLRTNDEVRKQRSSSCGEFWKVPRDESAITSKEPKNQETLCRPGAS